MNVACAVDDTVGEYCVLMMRLRNVAFTTSLEISVIMIAFATSSNVTDNFNGYFHTFIT